MARKNNLRSEVSGSIHFDSRTKTVMAEATHDNIKEKVQAVREVVPGKSNNEVVLVLQYYDYNVERAIQAYLEDGAKEALQEWNFTGSKQPNKKRRNKKKAAGDKASNKPGSAPPSSSASSANKKEELTVNGKADLPNGDIAYEVQPDREPLLESPSILTTTTTNIYKPPASTAAASGSLPASTAAASPSQESSTVTADSQPQRQPHTKGRGHGDSHHNYQHSPRERTVSEVSTGSGMGDGHHKKPHQGLEKAIKDLHRQTTSLERLRLLLNHEIDRSIKSMKSVFEELRQGLSGREAQLMAEMDVLKQEASEMLEMRQAKASELKRQVDRSDRLKDTEVSELRAEIKHFVSERRHDEDLGHTTRFLFDSDRILDEFKKFGEVVHVKSMYTTRRDSVLSVASSGINPEGNHDEDLSHSQEIHELQDRLKNSLKFQNSQNRGHASSMHSTSTQNGPGNDDSIRNKASRQYEQYPRQPSRSGSSRGRNIDSHSIDVSSSKQSASTSLSSAPPANSSYFQSSSNRGPPPSYSSNNTGSPGRGGRGSSNQSPRGGGRGRGRGGRGGGFGRGDQRYGSERSRPPSHQQETSLKRQSDASSSNTSSNQAEAMTSN